jgi:hypothetical protein
LKYRTYEGSVTCDGMELKAVGIDWLGATTADATDAVDPETKGDKGTNSEAADFLKGILKDGPLPTRTCINEMEAAGFDMKKLDSTRVRRKAGVETTNEGKFSKWSLKTKQEVPAAVTPDLWEEKNGQRV